LAGSINILKNGTVFDISCSNCNLTSCLDNYINDSLHMLNKALISWYLQSSQEHGIMKGDYR
jgi:hypothetical protein